MRAIAFDQDRYRLPCFRVLDTRHITGHERLVGGLPEGPVRRSGDRQVVLRNEGIEQVLYILEGVECHDYFPVLDGVNNCR